MEQDLKRHERFRHAKSPEAPGEESSPQSEAEPAPKRRRGGLPGHPKADRSLIPTEQCRRVGTCKPKTCRGCGTRLKGDDPNPLRHQVTDIPPIVPEVFEYQRHRLECPCCGVATCGGLPDGVPSGMTGPRLVAIVGLLMVLFHQSRRRVNLCCGQLLGVLVSLGLVVKLPNIVTESTRPAYDHLVSELPDQSAINVDETPTVSGTGRLGSRRL